MRSLLAISALLFAVSTPAMASDYPWCARTKGSGPIGDCSFASLRQCMATVSGQRGDCTTNPRLAYGQDRRWNRRRDDR
jgi:Protein of unknown function (DUF3551)